MIHFKCNDEIFILILYSSPSHLYWTFEVSGFSSYVTLKLNRGSVLMVPLRRDRVTKSKILKVIAHMCRNMFNIFLELIHIKRRKKVTFKHCIFGPALHTHRIDAATNSQPSTHFYKQ